MKIKSQYYFSLLRKVYFKQYGHFKTIHRSQKVLRSPFKTHQMRSSRKWNQGKYEKPEQEAREGETIVKGQPQLKLGKTKTQKIQLLFVWSLTYTQPKLSDPTRNMQVPACIACKIIETHKPPNHEKVHASSSMHIL